jgi:hypothetical protein
MAAGTPVYAGEYNVYVPNHESTQGMIVDFSRNPKDFSLNKWVKMFPVKQQNGYYARFGRDGGLPEEAARITDTALADAVWHDGNDAPDGNKLKELFQMVEHHCLRYATPWVLGDKTVSQASWSIKDQYARIAAQLSMTRRAQLAISCLTTTGNYPTGHFSAVSSISGVTGKWDVSTSARMDIRKSLDYGCEIIRLDTLGLVKRKDLRLVVSPGEAQAMSRSQEIIDILKQQANSIKIIEGTWEEKNFQFPAELYGVEVVIEDTVKATNAKGATRAVSNILADTIAALVSRPDGLEGTDSQAPNFSTISMFVYDQEEMVVEEMHDSRHKRVEGRVLDTIDTQITAGASGFLFTSTTG